jgi:hypothetical protein
VKGLISDIAQQPSGTVIPRFAETRSIIRKREVAKRGICCLAGTKQKHIPSTAQLIPGFLTNFAAVEG